MSNNDFPTCFIIALHRKGEHHHEEESKNVHRTAPIDNAPRSVNNRLNTRDSSLLPYHKNASLTCLSKVRAEKCESSRKITQDRTTHCTQLPLPSTRKTRLNTGDFPAPLPQYRTTRFTQVPLPSTRQNTPQYQGIPHSLPPDKKTPP